MDWKAALVIYMVVAARVLLPLLIPRHPLWALLGCLALDSADQSVMQAFGVDSPRYQSYDKALDVYYLGIAYLATMRNWENLVAFRISRFLFYFRLAGVLAFELTGLRLLLAVFPNAFEPFYLYYEMVRRRGNPMLLTRNAMLAIVGVIWFVFKLPHEWWVHIAKLDATDFVKTRILGASTDTSLWRAVIEAPAVTGTLVVLAAVLVLAVRRLLERRRRRAAQAVPAGRLMSGWKAHWRRPAAIVLVGAAARVQQAARTFRIAVFRGHTASHLRPRVLIEKIVLVSVVSVIFQQMLPGLEANGFHTALFVSVTIVATDFLLRLVLRRYGVPLAAHLDLALTAVINFVAVLVFQLLIPYLAPNYDLESALILAFLITLFVTLYDHYRPVYDYRAADAAAGRLPVAATDVAAVV